MKKPKCHYCDKPAKYLCDFVLGFTGHYDPDLKDCKSNEEFYQALLNPKDLDMKTCDRPLCEDHCTNRGGTFYCGEESEYVTHDFCPGHAHGPDHKPRPNKAGGGRAA